VNSDHADGRFAPHFGHSDSEDLELKADIPATSKPIASFDSKSDVPEDSSFRFGDQSRRGS
jgi:hypothetical protein